MEKKKVLFVCTYHGAGSRIAEEFAKQIAPEKIDAYSSSFDPRKISPLSIDVMREVGIDLPAESPKPVFTRHKEGDVLGYKTKEREVLKKKRDITKWSRR